MKVPSNVVEELKKFKRGNDVNMRKKNKKELRKREYAYIDNEMREQALKNHEVGDKITKNQTLDDIQTDDNMPPAEYAIVGENAYILYFDEEKLTESQRERTEKGNTDEG